MPALPTLSVPTLSMPRPYTLELQQGIVVDQKMVSRLTPGMTRNQVGLTLGTPLLTDVLHGDRWDYVYYTRKQGEVGEWRRFACLFKNDVLVQVTGDVTVAAAGSVPVSTVTPAPVTDPGTSSGVPQPLPDAGGPQK